MGDEEETLDDLDPGVLVAEVSAALSWFAEISLPYEAVVYEDGDIRREALANAEAARIKSESLYGESFFERDISGDEDDPDRITVRVRDPTEVARGEQ